MSTSWVVGQFESPQNCHLQKYIVSSTSSRFGSILSRSTDLARREFETMQDHDRLACVEILVYLAPRAGWLVASWGGGLIVSADCHKGFHPARIAALIAIELAPQFTATYHGPRAAFVSCLHSKIRFATACSAAPVTRNPLRSSSDGLFRSRGTSNRVASRRRSNWRIKLMDCWQNLRPRTGGSKI